MRTETAKTNDAASTVLDCALVECVSSTWTCIFGSLRKNTESFRDLQWAEAPKLLFVTPASKPPLKAFALGQPIMCSSTGWIDLFLRFVALFRRRPNASNAGKPKQNCTAVKSIFGL